MAGPYTIRPFSSTEDYRECVALQEATWGQGFSEAVSPAILKVGQILGGVSAGAYDESGRLVGFVFGLTGVRDGRVVHWSDMLAVRPEGRDGGLGRRLKEYQRERMLERGIDTMYWTFDPLQARNAHLNIARLGVVVREYRVDMYGDTDSPLHRGIGTDRFVALWLLDSERVRARLTGGRGDAAPEDSPGADVSAAGAPFALAAAPESGGKHPRPGAPDLSLGNPAIRVAIPSHVGALMDGDIDLAVEWRLATRRALDHYLSSGYEVSGFERGGRTCAYVVTRRSSTEP